MQVSLPSHKYTHATGTLTTSITERSLAVEFCAAGRHPEGTTSHRLSLSRLALEGVLKPACLLLPLLPMLPCMTNMSG